MSGCSFVNNSANYGGAIYNVASGLTVSGCSFVNNSDSNGGSVIYNYGFGSGTVDNSVFINNSANNVGGIYGSNYFTANDNWWGSNNPDWDKLVSDGVAHDTYAVLNLTATSDNITINFYRSGTTTVLPISRDVKLAIGDTKSTEKIVDGTFKTNYTAPEDVYTITASVDNQELVAVNQVYVDYVNGNDTNNGTGWDSSFKTISKAMELVMTNGRIYLADGTHVVDSQMKIDKTLTIIGNGSNTIIKHKNNQRVFSITVNDVAIYNSTFTGILDNYCGAIENYGDGLTVDGCTFANNFAELYGGAIYNKGANLVVNNCIFIKNIVEVNGGAIFNSGAGFTISNSTFVDNTAYKGGAIYTASTGFGIANDNWWGTNNPNWDKLVYGNVTYDAFAVLNLTANIDTIAIVFYRNGTDDVLPFSRDFKYTIDAGDSISEKIINGTFKTNYTTPRVGYYDITANVDNEKLTVNVDNNNVYVDPVNGNDTNNGASWSTAVKTISKAMDLVLDSGRIYLADGTHVVDNSRITVDKTVKIIGNGSKTIITNNNGTDGVFYITADEVTIYNSTFANNSASNNHGGAIINDGAGFTVSGCTFVNNFARYYGGVIYNNGANLVVDACTFVNNYAEWFASAIYNSYHANFTVSNSTFVNNTNGMKEYSFVIYSISSESSSANDNWWGNNTPDWNNLICGKFGKVDHDTFAVLNLTATTDTININFYRNGTNIILPISRDLKYTIYTGDAIYDKIINGTFKTNYIAPIIGTYNITASVDNEKLTINVDNNNVYVDPVNGNDTNNGASWSTAVKTISKAMELILENGNVYLADGTHIVNSCVDVAKTVTVIGNGSKTLITTNGKNRVFYITADDVAIYNCTFVNNSAYNGGAIYDDGAGFTVGGCTFVNNSAYNGGAIYYGGTGFTVGGCTFVNNSAYNGASIYNSIGSISVSDSNFTNNSANYGVIYNGGSGVLSLDNNKYSGINEGETYIYNIGFIVSPVNITVLENKTIKVHSGDIITLLATVTCDGVNVAGGTLKFVIGGAECGVAASNANGTYTLDYTINFSGEKIISVIYANANNATVNRGILNASKYDPLMNVTADNITFGQDLTVDVELPKDTNGNISVIIDGAIYSKAIKDGNVKLAIENLGAGLHSVIVKYSGSVKYLDSEVVKQINVAKAVPTLKVVIKDVNYNNAFIIKATLSGINNMALNGNVIVNINNKNYVVVVNNGEGELKVNDKLSVGQYTFTATWNENNNYTAPAIQGTFNVTTADTQIVVSVDDINVGENAEVIVRLASDATGEVKITIGNETYNVAIKEGVATKTLSNYKAGNYTVNVDYTGDTNYNIAFNTTNFAVFKNKCDIRLINNEGVYGSGYLYVVLPYDATGNVSITVGNYSYSTEVKNGFATIVLPLLDVGYYKFFVNYTGNDKYCGCVGSDYLFIVRANASLNVVISDVDYGKNSTVIVKLIGVNNASLTGAVYVRINNLIYEIDVVNGSGIFKGINIPVGEYNFTATWWGSLNYNVAQDKGTFKVAKINPTLDVDVNNINVGDYEIIEFILPESATGNVTIEIDGNTYTVDVEKGVKVISGLGAGNYTAIVTYNGDNNYNSVTVKEKFTVSKIDSKDDIEVITRDIIFGDNGEIIIILPKDATGNVTIFIDDIEDSTLTLNKGKANKTITGLNTGNHTIIITYDGDDKYNGAIVFTVINVAGVESKLNVNIGNVIYNEIFTINATLTGVKNTPLNGTVAVSVNGKTYNVVVTNGKGSTDGISLPAGEYNFTAIWEGNINYNVAQDNGTFNVAKVNPLFDISVEDIYVGDNETLIFILPDDATGNVAIQIANDTYNVAIEDGEKIISGLGEGNYTVKISYSGDNNYNGVTYECNFVVSKISEYKMDITISTGVKFGQDSIIKVNLPDDATGNVTVTVDGENYTAQVENATANINIPLLSVGVHNITTVYAGDERYNPITKQGSITILPNNVNLTADNIVMVYHDGTRLVATLTDTFGNPIANATLFFKLNGMIYDRITDKNGSASMALNLDSGKYTAVITYFGNASYNEAVVNVNITIAQSIIGQDMVKMYQNDTSFYATFFDNHAKPLANTNVTFNINGVFYTRGTDANGTAKLNINLRPGNYTLTAYNPVTGEEQGFNVLIKSLIVASDLTKYYNNESKFQAKVYNKDGSLATNKSVIFNINGVLYARQSDENGTVSLAINLIPDDYVITTIYDGLEVSNNVKILPTLITENLAMSYHDESAFNATTLDGEGNPLANQTVLFNVNGVFYNRTTGNDGVASLTINLNKGNYIITSIWDDYHVGNKITIS